jgi:hypothetical protein
MKKGRKLNPFFQIFFSDFPMKSHNMITLFTGNSLISSWLFVLFDHTHSILHKLLHRFRIKFRSTFFHEKNLNLLYFLPLFYILILPFYYYIFLHSFSGVIRCYSTTLLKKNLKIIFLKISNKNIPVQKKIFKTFIIHWFEH